MTFAPGATIEQRYPGATPDLARASARDRIESFKALGWDVREERWVSEGIAVSSLYAGSSSSAVAPGWLVVVFVAVREASVPSSLVSRSVEAEPDARWSSYVVRLVVGLVIFAIVVGVLLSIGIPFISGMLHNGSPATLVVGRLA
jgi:hypothetical protein